MFVTPNRLTFGPPDEIIDPYHFVEFASDELEALCRARFEEVEMHGLFGSPRYMELSPRSFSGWSGCCEWTRSGFGA